MRKLFRAGFAIQAASAATLVAQNFLAPRLMGAEAYGKAVALMVLPLLLQGVIEPMLNGAAIAAQSCEGRLRMLRRSWSHLCAVSIPTVALILWRGRGLQATTGQLLLLAFFSIVVLASTALRGLAFAGQRHRVLVWHFVGAFLATATTLPLFAGAGSTGYLAMMCSVQLTVLIILLGDRPLRAEAAEIIRQAPATGADYNVMRIYAANLAMRAGQLAIGPGMLLLASGQMVPVRLAEFRLCQSLIGAAAYMVPVNSTLIQAYAGTLRNATGQSRSDHTGGILHAVMLVLILTMVVMFLLWLAYPQIVRFLLHRDPGIHDFRDIIWVTPFFVCAPLLGGLLLGMGFERAVLIANLVIVTGSIMIGMGWGAEWGVVIGAVALAVSLVGVALRGHARQIQIGNGHGS